MSSYSVWLQVPIHSQCLLWFYIANDMKSTQMHDNVDKLCKVFQVQVLQNWEKMSDFPITIFFYIRNLFNFIWMSDTTSLTSSCIFVICMKSSKSLRNGELQKTITWNENTCADGSKRFHTPTIVLVSGSPIKFPSQATWTWAGLYPVFMHSMYSIFC